MGIHGGLLGKLPGGTNKDYRYQLQKAGLKGKRVNLDAAGLLWSCANRHSKDYLNGDYYMSVAAVQEELVYLQSVLEWKLVVVFDGKDPACWKDAEHGRRYGADDVSGDGAKTKIKNTGTYIALCVKVCKS